MPLSPKFEPQKISLQVAKCWQGKTYFLCWQASIRVTKDQLTPQIFKKIYLILTATPNRQECLKLSAQKPSSDMIQEGGVFAALVRKHIHSQNIGDIYEDSVEKKIWISFDQYSWYVVLSWVHSEISLISVHDRQTLIRFGPKGTFTHKKPYEGSLPHENKDHHISVLADLAEHYLSSLQTESLAAEILQTETISITLSPFQRESRDRLNRRLKTVKKASERLQASLITKEQVEELKVKSELLQSYSYLIKPDLLRLELSSMMSGLDVDIQIDLDPDLTAGQNIEAYFKKLKKAKNTLKLTTGAWEKSCKELKEIEVDLHRLRSSVMSDEEIFVILKRHHLLSAAMNANKSQQIDSSLPYKEYKSSDGLVILVGKGSLENDILTKSARSNDFWLHVREGSGSHIIIPRRHLGKQPLPLKTKKEAAILALHYSKIRENHAGELYFTEKQHLKKQKGMPPGLWKVEKSESYYVTYSEVELKAILNRLAS